MQLRQIIVWTALAALTATIGYLCVTMSVPQAAVAQGPPSPPPISPIEAALSVGLHAESLAVAQLDSEDFDTMLDLLTEAGTLRQTYANQFAAAATAADAMAALQAQVNAGSVDEPTLSALASAVQARNEANAALATTKEALFAAAVDGLLPAEVARLEAFRASSTYRVPLQYRCLERTPEQWRAIVAACLARDRATRLDHPLATEHAQLLTAVEAEQDVIAAAAAIPTLMSELGPHVAAILNPS